MEKLLEDVQNRLLSKVAALKYVDEDWGQLDFYSPNPPAKFPCVLIDISQGNWSNTLKLVQMGLLQVKIRFAVMRLSNTSGKAPAGQKQNGLSAFGILKDIYKALHGYSGSRHYTKLIRVTTARIKRDDGLRIYEMVFTTELTDASASPEYDKIQLSPKINTED